MQDDLIKTKVQELINLGKGKSEMQMWLELLPNLTELEKSKLLDNLEAELKLIKE